jgi:NAD(P)H-dependent FMN reductase
MTVISIIVGSTCEGRFSEKPARWILQHLKKRDGVDARLLDLPAYRSASESPMSRPASRLFQG